MHQREEAKGSGVVFTLPPLTGPKQKLQFGDYSASSWWKRKLGESSGESLVAKDLPKEEKNKIK